MTTPMTVSLYILAYIVSVIISWVMCRKVIQMDENNPSGFLVFVTLFPMLNLVGGTFILVGTLVEKYFESHPVDFNKFFMINYDK